MTETGLASDAVLELRKTIADVLDRDEDAIGYDTHFIDDLHADSLMALEVLVSLEAKYKVKLGEDELKRMTCLRSVHELLTGKGAFSPSAPEPLRVSS